MDSINYYNSLRSQYSIHNTFKFNGESIYFYGKGKIEIGMNSYVGSFSTLQSDSGYKISIGRNCRISHNVRMYTTSIEPDQDFNIFHGLENKLGNITIGDAVWIGVNTFINPGVTIGSNSIIGANSVVTHDIPENAIVGGVPAKIIRIKNLNA